jgi:hypothetical protein
MILIMCIRINKNVSSTFVINTTDTAKRDLDGHSRPSVAERPVQPSSSIVSNDRSSSASSVPSSSWQDIYYKTGRRYRRLVLVQGRHLVIGRGCRPRDPAPHSLQQCFFQHLRNQFNPTQLHKPQTPSAQEQIRAPWMTSPPATPTRSV